MQASASPAFENKALPAAAVGRGTELEVIDVAYREKYTIREQGKVKIGSTERKVVRLTFYSATWDENDQFAPTQKFIDRLIPNEYGRIDTTILTLPYARNYGRLIRNLNISYEDNNCEHEFGWADVRKRHVWTCLKCGARNPVAPMSAQNGLHDEGFWDGQELKCTVCELTLGRDTTPPEISGIEDGETYLVNGDELSFTVKDIAAEGEKASGVKAVYIDDVEQTEGSFAIPADGQEHTVRAVDNAGNETVLTVTAAKNAPLPLSTGTMRAKFGPNAMSRRGRSFG